MPPAARISVRIPARLLLAGAGALLLAGCDSSEAASSRGRAADAAPAAGPAGAPAWTWSAPRPLPPSLASFAAAHPRMEDVRAEPGGRVHVVFVDDADRDRLSDRILYARLEGGAWSEPETLDGEPGMSAAPRVVVDGRGQVHVLWYEGRDPRIPRAATHLLHRVWDGRAWSATGVLYHETSPRGLGDLHLAATVDREGRVQVVHPRAANGLAHLTLGGGAERSMERDGAYLRWDAAVRPGGDLALVYVAAYTSSFTRSANNDVWYRAFRGGRWDEPVPVHRGEGWSHEPVLLTDGEGVRHVVWLEGADQGRSDRVLYVRSDDGARWSEPADITPATPGPPGDFQAPRLALDGEGRVILVITRHEGVLGKPRHFQLRLDGGRWSAAVQMFPELGPGRSLVETAPDGQGTLHAVWRAGDGVYRHASAKP